VESKLPQQAEAMPKVMAGGPVRDREWSIPLWLGGLLDADYPRHLLTLAILVNDSQDGTFEACRWWGDLAKREGFGRVVIARQDFGTLADNNLRSVDDARDYSAFAKARQAWIGLARDEQKFFSVDSDVQTASDTLSRLVALSEQHQAAMLAAVLRNHAGAPYHHTNVMHWRDNGEGRRYLEHDFFAWEHPDTPGVRPCDLTGACVLLDRGCFDDGRGYLSVPASQIAAEGEDEPFCAQLRAAGLQPHFAPSVRVTHWMEPPADLRYVQRADWHRRQAAWHAHAAETGQAQGQPLREADDGEAE